MKRAFLLVLSLTALSLARPARAGFFDDAIQLQILQQSIQQSLNMGQQLNQLRSVLQSTREQLDLARNAYALGQDVVNFNSAQFLSEAQRYFVASQPVLSDAKALGTDIATRGVKNSFFNASQFNRMIVVYQEDKRAAACGCNCNGSPLKGADEQCLLVCVAAHERGYPYSGCAGASSSSSQLPYDEDAAKRLSAAADVAAYDQKARDALLAKPADSSVSDGLFYADLARTDPAALDALLRQRAVAAKAASAANNLYIAANNKNMSVATSGAITARTSSLAAEQLAAIREAQAKQVALQERQVTREDIERAREGEAQRRQATRMSGLLYEAVSSRRPPSDGYAP